MCHNENILLNKITKLHKRKLLRTENTAHRGCMRGMSKLMEIANGDFEFSDFCELECTNLGNFNKNLKIILEGNILT